MEKVFIKFLCALFVLMPMASFAAGSEPLFMKRLGVHEVDAMQRTEIGIKTSSDETMHFNVELAITPEQQAKGLMYRTVMGDYEGMLFLFEDIEMRSFWMKNTLIPLDIIFLDHDGTILHIHHNAKPQDLSHISSKYPNKAVLELNGGITYKLGIKEGDQVLHDAFMNTDIPSQ